MNSDEHMKDSENWLIKLGTFEGYVTHVIHTGHEKIKFAQIKTRQDVSGYGEQIDLSGTVV